MVCRPGQISEFKVNKSIVYSIDKSDYGVMAAIKDNPGQMHLESWHIDHWHIDNDSDHEDLCNDKTSESHGWKFDV